MSFSFRHVARLSAVAVLAFAVPTSLAAAASAAPADPVAYCSARAENPHVSSTPGAGIELRLRFTAHPVLVRQ